MVAVCLVTLKKLLGMKGRTNGKCQLAVFFPVVISTDKTTLITFNWSQWWKRRPSPQLCLFERKNRCEMIHFYFFVFFFFCWSEKNLVLSRSCCSSSGCWRNSVFFRRGQTSSNNSVLRYFLPRPDGVKKLYSQVVVVFYVGCVCVPEWEKSRF